MRFFLFIIFLFVFAKQLSSQTGYYNSNWIIGYDSTANEQTGTVIKMNFTADSLEATVEPAPEIYSAEFGSTVSDSCGNFMFHFNGCHIISEDGNYVEEATFLSPGEHNDEYCPFGTSTLIDGTLLLNSPYVDSIIYAFNLHLVFERNIDSNDLLIGSHRLFFHILDAAANDGQGKLIVKNEVIIEDTLGSAGVVATRHANGRDWWVVVPKNKSNCYYRILINENGPTVQDTTCSGVAWDDNDVLAPIKFSNNGSRMLRYNSDNGIHIYNFDNQTGKLSNGQKYDPKNTPISLHGLAISPNGRFVYTSKIDSIFQYDLEAPDFLASQVLLDTFSWDFMTHPAPVPYGLMQLAPDGKIYISGGSTHYNLHVIHDPDEPGLDCNLEPYGLELPSWNFLGLPNMPYYAPPTWERNCHVVTSTKQPEPLPVELFPNPATEILYLTVPVEATITLVNALGEVSLQESVPVGQSELTINRLPRGWYVATIRSADGKRVAKEKLILH